MSRTLRWIALAVAAFSAAPALAKPLYITVPRSYGSRESAALDVAFEGRAPVELRVLKPTPLAPFLRAQSNLRRAYAAPTTTINPGRYLTAGLNRVHSPGAWLLHALSPKWRMAVEGVPHRAPDTQAPAAHPLSKLDEGPEKLVGIPPGMTLVHREWLNLDLGGDVAAYDVPGFSDWFGGEGGYQQRRVKLAPLPPGLYVVQVVQGRVEGQVVLSVTDLKVQVKQTDGALLVRVAGADLKPVPGAKVQVYLGAHLGASGITDAQGELRLKNTEPRVLLTASTANDLAVVDTDFYSTLAVVPDAFIYADRPIYKPGDTVHFRGVARQPDSFLARLFTPKHRAITVSLHTQDNRVITTHTTLDDFGCFAGALQVPPGLDTGVLRLDATLDGRHDDAEARVQQYVKPTFYVELQGQDETVQPGGTITLHVRARRYAGGPATNTRYEYFLYRAQLDAPQWIQDSGLGAKGSDITYGTEASQEASLRAPERLYSSLAARDTGLDGDPWASAAKLDANGEADLTIAVPKLGPGDDRRAWTYTVTVRARDDQGSFANAAKKLFLAPTEVLGTVRPSAKLVKQGAPATLAVRATTLSGKPAPGTRGSVHFALRDADDVEHPLGEQAFTTDAAGTWQGALPTAQVGTVLCRVSLTDKNGHTWTGEDSALVMGASGVPVAKVATLSLQALGGTLQPGDTAELVALFPQSWGAQGKSQGPVWITLCGSGIFATHLVQVTGTTLAYPFPIEERFGSAVYAQVAYPTEAGRWIERTTAFRIVPRTRTLHVQVEPGQAEAKPLGEQSIDLRVTDALGHGVKAEVSLGVVDKAVYAVQSEFRPGILDFFYPLSRNNVSTFQSAEFQGYGYGEVLARKLGLLTRTQFAAVKPPTHKPNEKDRDTAYWNPAVVTDAQGFAHVVFTLPSNQTLWVATAVAADASGRFGEGKGEFAARGAINLVTSLPSFLRQGDTATGSVRVASNAGPVHFTAHISATGAMTAAAAPAVIDVKAGGEQVVPFALTSTGTGTGALTVTLQGQGQTLADTKQVVVRPAAVDQTVSAVAVGGGDLDLALPAGAHVVSTELSLQPSTVAAALSNVQDLLDYPYGCLEQLVSTTVPNLALSQTLEASGALADLDPQSRALLALARSRAAQGTQRILDLEVRGGGFTWFGGYSQPDAALTLIALDGLSYAVKAGVVPASDPRIAESLAWIQKQDDLPPVLQATRTYVLAELLHQKAAPAVRALVTRAAPSDPYELALAVLAAEQAGVAQEPAFKAQVAALVDHAQQAMISNAVYTPHGDAFWRYPIRQLGVAAIVTHAASFGAIDVAAARKQIVAALSDPELSTFDRSTILLHSLWLIGRDAKDLQRRSPPAVDAAGAAITLTPRGLGLAAAVDPKVTHVSVGAFEGVATLKAQVRTPLASVQAESHGMQIERTYYAIREAGLVKLGPESPVGQGEDVYVELTLDAHGGDAAVSTRSAYYVVNDPVPAGFTPLTDDSAFRGPPNNLPLDAEALKRRSLSPEHATFFFEEPTWWSDSPHRVGYVMRAQFPGTFQAPPATVNDMYAASQFGRTAAATLTIAPSAASAQ